MITTTHKAKANICNELVFRMEKTSDIRELVKLGQKMKGRKVQSGLKEKKGESMDLRFIWIHHSIMNMMIKFHN